jgi:hypothetical protein
MPVRVEAGERLRDRVVGHFAAPRAHRDQRSPEHAPMCVPDSLHIDLFRDAIPRRFECRS